MRTIDFDYHLPEELIADRPLADRAASRMLVVHRDTGMHVVIVTRKKPQHAIRILTRDRLSEWSSVDLYEGIRGYDDTVGIESDGYGLSLSYSEELHTVKR